MSLIAEQMNKDNVTQFFAQLCGSQLSSVEFVQDYLQLRFDGPCINVYSPLTVTSTGKAITSWNAGFRDLLCEQITKIVTSITFEAQKELRIHFSDSSEIILSLQPQHYNCPEAIYAHGFDDNQWLVI
jgi:hypothetical protein